MDLSNYNWWKVLDTFASHYKFRLQQAPPKKISDKVKPN